MNPFCMKRSSFAFLIALVVPVAAAMQNASAQVHGSCSNCGDLVVISETGVGYARDWEGLCGKCYLEQDQGWFDINEHRYVVFADGTMIDMKHFRGSTLLSLFGSYSLGGPINGILFANGVGWLIELNQYRNGHPSGHPFGGNEDLLSNFAGSVFAQAGYNVFSDENWAQQAVPLLESIYGPVRHVTDNKKEK